MLRYYFNYRINEVFEKDLEDSKMPPDQVVLEEAQFAARELLAAKIRVDDLSTATSSKSRLVTGLSCILSRCGHY